MGRISILMLLGFTAGLVWAKGTPEDIAGNYIKHLTQLEFKQACLKYLANVEIRNLVIMINKKRHLGEKGLYGKNLSTKEKQKIKQKELACLFFDHQLRVAFKSVGAGKVAQNNKIKVIGGIQENQRARHYVVRIANAKNQDLRRHVVSLVKEGDQWRALVLSRFKFVIFQP